ncbi:terminase TerL endonuclease subunit [Aeoliella sp.]|uniref:terminase TerL endonuclease subunit n=1 Tax=Aeoliella sp. TaxID=2795800 RepID=UPI003CCB9ABD
MKITKDDLFQLPTDSRARDNGYYVDTRLADLVEQYISRFKICSDDFSGKAGRSFELLRWQRAAIRTLYSWYRPDGTYRFRRCLWWLPRRQGKSILTSSILGFTMEQNIGAEAYVIASTKEQAGIIYNYSESFVQSANRPFRCVPSHKKLVCESTGSEAKVLSSDRMQGKSGTSTSLLLYDEVHEHVKHAARETYSRLMPSLGSKRNSLFISISTAGHDKDSLSFDLWKESKDILTGKNTDLHCFPIIYALTDKDDWTDENNWWKVLPSAGVTVPKTFYQEEFDKAKNNPFEENSFKRQYLNLWTGSLAQWIPTNLVDACKSDFRESDFYGCEVVAGFDYAASYDLCSYVLIAKKDDNFFVIPRFFLPREVAEKKQEKTGTRYLDWAKDQANNFHLTEGDTVDAEYLLEQVKKDSMLFKIRSAYYDKTRMEVIRQQIAALGIETVGISQGTTTTSPLFNYLERLLHDGKLKFPRNNIMYSWCLDNCEAKRDSNDNLIVKKSNDESKIDSVDATAFALAHWVTEQKGIGPPPEGQKLAMIW